MLKNYFKIAWRNLNRNKGYAFINILGLAVGLAACLLIALWVRHETSYDEFHENVNRLYRIVLNVKEPTGRHRKFSDTPDVLAFTLQTEGVPAVKKAIRFDPADGLFSRGPERQFYEEHVFRADPAALTAFSFTLRHGNRQTALDKPHSVVLSPNAARRYFPNDPSPLGRTLKRGYEQTLEVTGGNNIQKTKPC